MAGTPIGSRPSGKPRVYRGSPGAEIAMDPRNLDPSSAPPASFGQPRIGSLRRNDQSAHGTPSHPQVKKNFFFYLRRNFGNFGKIFF